MVVLVRDCGFATLLQRLPDVNFFTFLLITDIVHLNSHGLISRLVDLEFAILARARPIAHATSDVERVLASLGVSAHLMIRHGFHELLPLLE